ncbi:hypothetical protein [uncultured Nostoc sp.]|uniref:hypothetical protein n=1 Tax=uncultured Nostoc sp. TaxID=340711 RepID=UPI0035CBD6FC
MALASPFGRRPQWLRCTHKSEKLHPPKICGEAALREGFPPQATAVSAALATQERHPFA